MAEVDVNHVFNEVIVDDSWKEEYGEEYFEYRRMWGDVPRKGLRTKFPMHLDIEITNVCNLLCPFCPRTLMIKKGIEVSPYYLNFDVFKRAIDMGKDKGLYAINLNAAGETLFHKDIAKMVAYAKKNGVLDIMFHTNATLLTEDISEELIDAGLDKLIVSFDSPIKEHYEQLRIGAKYDEVIGNIRKFVEIRNKKKKKLPQVRINMVVMKENENEKDEMIELWKPYVNSIGFLTCINPMGMDDKVRSSKSVTYDNNFICEKLWQRMTIDHNGNIKMCHMDELGEVTLGNVLKDDIEQVWNGEKMNYYRKLHLCGRISEISSCKICGMPQITK